MRIFQDGRTGSIRIIARDEAEQARSLADDEAGDGSESPQPHTRGGRPVVHVVMTSLPPVVSDSAQAKAAFPDSPRAE